MAFSVNHSIFKSTHKQYNTNFLYTNSLFTTTSAQLHLLNASLYIGGRPPVSPRNPAPARQGGGRSGRKAQRERNMAYQKIGMDAATTASAANRRPESFHQKSPRTLNRRSNQRNAELATAR